jgi:hypothetical protein
LAAKALKQKKAIAQTSVRNVQQTLLDAGGYLMPYLDLPKTDVHFKAVQRIGATGILKGEGKNVGWSNETWFNVDKLVNAAELKKDLMEFEPNFSWKSENKELVVNEAIELVYSLATFYRIKKVNQAKIIANWQKLQLSNYDAERKITRKELAVLLDTYINPFELKNVDMKGNYIKR